MAVKMFRVLFVVACLLALSMLLALGIKLKLPRHPLLRNEVKIIVVIIGPKSCCNLS